MAKYEKTLWKFTDPKDRESTTGVGNQLEEQGIESTATGYGPAPQLAPVGSMDTAEEIDVIRENPRPQSKFKMKTINVKDTFPWTYSNELSRNDVPQLILREERILQNPTINALAYNAFAGLDHLKDMVDNVSEGANGASQWIGDRAQEVMKFAGFSKTTTENINKFGTAVRELVTEAMKNDELGDKHKNFNTKDYRQHMEPYQRLYSTYPTGFKYKFPYFSDEYKAVTTSFDGAAGDQAQLPFQQLAAKGTSLIGSIVNTFNALKPGTYIEAPKYASFPTSNYSYSTSFPLLNTVSFDQTFRNWQLLFMLVYQNLPNRVNRSVILPPKVYECRIPGVWYSRYSHIQSLQINMVGSRREMMIPSGSIGLPGGGTDGRMRVIVPDAWEVSLTVTELIPESQNYMFESIMRDGLITIDTRDQANVSKKGSEAFKSALGRSSGQSPPRGANPSTDDFGNPIYTDPTYNQ